MSNPSTAKRERAFRFDLFIASDWGARFDAIVAEHAKLPKKGRLLDLNCGTGARAIALAEELAEGEVIGIDEDPNLIAIANAKIGTAPGSPNRFEVAKAEQSGHEADGFDAVLLDATLTQPARLEAMASEAVRIARPDAPIVVSVALRGTFDEFHSVFWEAIHDIGIDDKVWARLEQLINHRPTAADATAALKSSGIKGLAMHQSKEEWRFESGEAFLRSPLVSDLFLREWVSILPEERQADVMRHVAEIIDREVDGHYFEVSAKAAVFVGHK